MTISMDKKYRVGSTDVRILAVDAGGERSVVVLFPNGQLHRYNHLGRTHSELPPFLTEVLPETVLHLNFYPGEMWPRTFTDKADAVRDWCASSGRAQGRVKVTIRDNRVVSAEVTA